MNDLNTATQQFVGAGSDNTSGLVFAGETPTEAYTAKTEIWNGTSWTNDQDVNTARNNLGGAGIQSAAVAFGGLDGGGFSAATEEWYGDGKLTDTFTI